MAGGGEPLGTHQFTGPGAGVKGGEMGKARYVSNLARPITPAIPNAVTVMNIISSAKLTRQRGRVLRSTANKAVATTKNQWGAVALAYVTG